MKWKNILLASVLTTSLTGLVNLDVQAAKNSKDITPPAIPSYNINKYINVSNDGNFEIKGKGESNSTVLITLSDNTTKLLLSGKTDAKGNFKIKVNTKKLIEGKVTLTIQNVDKAGNKSKVKSISLIKDITLEELSIDNEGFINALTQLEYPVSGTADLGSKIEVTLKSGKAIVSGKGTVDELGNYSVDLDAKTLSDGNVKITVKQTDKAGNTESQVVEVEKDTKAPNNPLLLQAAVLQSETVTNYVVNGLGVINGEVEITLSDGLNDVSSIGTVDENGLFQVELNAASLLDGEITITAKQTNEAGNESTESTIKTSKDSTAPVKPTIDPLAIITSANQGEYTITGQGEQGATVQLLITDGTATITAIGVVDEVGKFTIKANVTTLKTGNVIVLASQTDTVKNVGPVTTALVAKE